MSRTSNPAWAKLKRECKNNPARFNRRILGRSPYWYRQAEICESVRDYPVTLVPAGNMVGKSFVAAGLILWFLAHHPGGMVLCTAPTQVQLQEVLWKEVERAYQGSRIPLGGRLLRSPHKVDLGGGWQALAYSTTKTERLSGHHAGDFLAVLDESSGIEPEIIEAVDSCNPSRLLMLGNPLRPDGPFYERCQNAEAAPDNPDVRLIRIPSLESPDIGIERSTRGMADATWLRKARNDYGESSIWWLSHVLAMFPDSAADSLIVRTWLDLAALTVHRKAGPRRMSVDVAEGNDGDPAGYLVRDDTGIHACRWSPNWDMDTLADKVQAAAVKLGVEAPRITYDASGVGADFGNRLASKGLVGCIPYKGGYKGGASFANLRSAAAWRMRQRLDPNRMVTEAGLTRKQEPFAIPPELLGAGLRRELQALKYHLLSEKKVALEDKEQLKRALGGKSPTFADLLIMSFAYPNA